MTEETDLNYEAYLRDLPELQKTFASSANASVAYFNGQRVAAGNDAEELIHNIPENLRREPLFVTEVFPAPIKFRRPFFRH